MPLFKTKKSLKYKLAVSHVSMIVIPLVLLAMAQLMWHHLFSDKFLAPEASRTEDILRRNASIIAGIDSSIAGNPDKLLDKECLRQINHQVDKNFLFVLVEKDGEFVYIPEKVDVIGLKAASLGIRSGAPDPRGYLLLKYRDFKFSDNSIGSVYLLSENKPRGPAEEIILVIALMLGMIINIIISYRVASNIIAPLGVLNKATSEIASGNLDNSIEPSSEDEVGELCRSFESMRKQLKQAQNLSKSYEKNRKELIANISHDLKTPITSIRGYVQGIMEGIANTPEKERKYIQTIYSNAMHLERLIDELFLFSKLDLNQLEFDFGAIDIEDFLNDCVEDKGYDLEIKGITLNFTSFYCSKALVKADRQRLQRVINNIITNAEQHQNPDRKQGVLDIILRENNDEAIVEIKDNGQGISRESLPHIFDRLYRGDPSRNRQNKGSGLGLSIARQIIDAHGGRIWAESEEGRGTSIFFTLKKCFSENETVNTKNTGVSGNEDYSDR